MHFQKSHVNKKQHALCGECWHWRLFWEFSLDKVRKFATTLQKHLPQNNIMADVPYLSVERAKWIGFGELWPLSCIANAKHWTPKQNREYQQAFEKQKFAMQKALEVETPDAKESRMFFCGARAPSSSDEVFDKCWSIKEIEKIIEFKKGLIFGLEHGRDRNEAMLAQTKSEVVVLETQQMELVENFYKNCPQHFQRYKLHAFTRQTETEFNGEGGGIEESTEVNVANLGKRRAMKEPVDSASLPKKVIPSESSEYWLSKNRIRTAMTILSWDVETGVGDEDVL